MGAQLSWVVMSSDLAGSDEEKVLWPPSPMTSIVKGLVAGVMCALNCHPSSPVRRSASMIEACPSKGMASVGETTVAG
jgi:hypothetical protein